MTLFEEIHKEVGESNTYNNYLKYVFDNTSLINLIQNDKYENYKYMKMFCQKKNGFV